MSSKLKPKIFLVDVDGVMTDGKIYQSLDGKVMKVFGPDDHDALKLLQRHVEVQFVSGDRSGFPLSEARIVGSMKMPLSLVSTSERLSWIAERWDLRDVAYMGDGIFDHYVISAVGYGIAPANADRLARESADYVTERASAERAVAEAALHLMERFFQPYDPQQPVDGIW